MSRKLDHALACLIYDPDATINQDLMIGAKNKKEKIPRFSEDGNAMLELDREMMLRGYKVSIERLDDDIYETRYYLNADGRHEVALAISDTEQEARARAAYYALTGEEWEEAEDEKD